MAVDLDPSHDSLLIVFAGLGLGGKYEKPQFEFPGVLKRITASKIFLRDPHRLWYLAGIPGVGDCAEDIGLHLLDLVEEAEPERVICLGASAGAYAAILFGTFIGATQIHAFGPQTRLLHPGDSRFQDQLATLHRLTGTANPYLDLGRLLAEDYDGSSDITIYYDPGNTRDQRHADRLRGIPNVVLKRVEGGGHRVARQMRDGGQLTKAAAVGVGECGMRRPARPRGMIRP